jgi:antitoxin (DNA-binding transcriptional repressor) of toxin-antitoxin stability system
VCQLGVIVALVKAQSAATSLAARAPVLESNGNDSSAQLPRRNHYRKSHLPAMCNVVRLGDMNKTIGIAVAKARLFEMIDRVELGETSIIVRNGAPVAQLRPLERESLEHVNRHRFAKRHRRTEIAAASRAMNANARPDQSVFS